MIKLKRLRIGKYRNVAPGTELVFSDGFNVLLGPNGTGKTTLLKLIVMLFKSDFSALRDEEFDLEYELEDEEAWVQVVVRNNSRPSQQVKFGALFFQDDEHLEWSFRITFGSAGSSEKATIAADAYATKVYREDAIVPEEQDTPLATMPLFQGLLILRCASLILKKGMLSELGERVEDVFVYGVADASQNLGRFDETLGSFTSMTGGMIFWGGQVDEPPIATLRTQMVDGVHRVSLLSTFTPGEPGPTREWEKQFPTADALQFSARETPYLADAIRILGFLDAQGSFRLLQRDSLSKPESASFGNLRFTLTLDEGTAIAHDYLSYGQKRLLSFFYYLAANSDIVVADELVNGMHHEWIRACLDAIGSRQAFLTSQNPLLLDCLPTFTSPEDVQRCFILCGREKREKRSYMTWKNMSIEEAESFFRAYEAGIQHVGDILRTKGLW